MNRYEKIKFAADVSFLYFLIITLYSVISSYIYDWLVKDNFYALINGVHTYWFIITALLLITLAITSHILRKHTKNNNKATVFTIVGVLLIIGSITYFMSEAQVMNFMFSFSEGGTGILGKDNDVTYRQLVTLGTYIMQFITGIMITLIGFIKSK